MSYKIIRKQEHKINHWSGGTTTQVLIYPDDADYKKRNFKWRLSSAEISDEESDFTPLPGFKRIIMILKGNIKLVHKNQYEVNLKAFEQNSFLGEWETKSYGKATDFNLMLAKDYDGEIQALEIAANDKKNLLIENNKKSEEYTQAFYCSEGKAEIYFSDNKIEKIYQGDLLIFNISEKENNKIIIKNIDEKETHFIKSEIWNLCLKKID